MLDMNQENQNTEYKETWRDDYLKWICGFANAQGGRLLVGVNDKGQNDGILPEGWTVETLLSSHRSMPYNPDIANTFFRAGEIEAWGRGIERIIKGCESEGFSTVEFRYDACGLWTTFQYQYPERAADPTDIVETTKKTIKKTTKKTTDKLLLQNKITNYLKQNPYATVREVRDHIDDVTLSGIQYHIKRLKILGILQRIGPDKGGYWQVKDIQS